MEVNQLKRTAQRSRGAHRAPYGGFFEYDRKKERLEEVGRELEDPAVWSEPERAQELGASARA